MEETNNFQEHPLDSMLDDEPDSLFGVPLIKDPLDHHAQESVRGNLSEWSAQDFAGIYVRFRPHLERHAKRYLSDDTQAEEVVQEAFLYLMTSLPELDSELGVLKFLKWKVKMLSYDVLRARSTQKETSFPDFGEYSKDYSDMSVDLERAEDSAVIRLALAKLNPRHREALIASVYEEKTPEQVATQLGLSSNAARQLLFRARGAFRKALVGEAETNGKSIGQILSIATKKAAESSKENMLKIGAFIILSILGVGLTPSLNSSEETFVAELGAEELPAPSYQPVPDDVYSSSNLSPNEVQADQSLGSLGSEPANPDAEGLTEEPKTASQIEQIPLQTISPPKPLDLSDQDLGGILDTNITQAGMYTDSYARLFGETFDGVSVEVFGGTGISAFLDLNVDTKTVDKMIFQMGVSGRPYFAVAGTTDTMILDKEEGRTIIIVAEKFYVIDESKNIFSESPLSDARAEVNLELSADGAPQSASLKVKPLTSP